MQDHVRRRQVPVALDRQADHGVETPGRHKRQAIGDGADILHMHGRPVVGRVIKQRLLAQHAATRQRGLRAPHVGRDEGVDGGEVGGARGDGGRDLSKQKGGGR